VIYFNEAIEFLHYNSSETAIIHLKNENVRLYIDNGVYKIPSIIDKLEYMIDNNI